MVTDAKQLDRTAQSLVVEAKRAHGSPPDFDTNWRPVWAAKVDRIEINRDGRPSVATIWFPDLYWHETRHLLQGDMVRIRTNERSSYKRTVLFAGFITSYLSDFSGGTDQPKSSFERNAIVACSYRWLLAATCPLFGQIARGPDDYTDYGTDSQAPIANSYTYLSGRRAIFNAHGKPNRDPSPLKVHTDAGTELCEMPIFANPGDAEPWTVRDMIRYILSPKLNKAFKYWEIKDPNDLTGLDHSDFDNVFNHVVVDGLNILEALQTICRQIGWGFREDYDNDSTVNLIFYKIGSASQYSRDSDNPTILQRLHAPAVGENVSTAVAAGKKLLWSMSLAEDIAPIVNKPYGLGAPHRFEFTAELIPAWLDSDLEPDTSYSNARLFFTDADLQEMTDKDSKTFFKYYHPRGGNFRRNVGRKWALNESGYYSSGSYDRGMPFDFADVLPEDYIKNDSGNRLFAPFNRHLLPCLTADKETLNSVGIKVEFSFDGGETWQVIPAAIAPLSDECGLYITEPNLAELVDQSEGTISAGILAGVQLNFFSSLADDKLNDRTFKTGQWNTRLRVTASVQMDQRLRVSVPPTSVYGSPFHQSAVFDVSEKYKLDKRAESSTFEESDLPALEQDSTDYFDKHLESVRDANQDMSVSAQFTLERLWLGDGSGEPDFALGDSIEKITGREYDLSAEYGDKKLHPEIIQIIYLPDKQKMKLITRDLRFAEVPL